MRITPRSLDILARGSPVCGDLAVSLSQAGPQFTQVRDWYMLLCIFSYLSLLVSEHVNCTQVLRGVYAIKALRFSTALSVLKDEFLRSRDYPRCPPTSHLFHQFRQLGYSCIKYAAKTIFVLISDARNIFPGNKLILTN